MAARYFYGVIFLLTNLIAWLLRDYSGDDFASLPYMKGCMGDRLCLATEGVLRISFGCFVFFLVMYLTTVGTTRVGEPRDVWHCGWWLGKFLLWTALMVLPFFVPTTFIKIYGELARFGAWIFLGIQLLAIVNLVWWWNDKWTSQQNVRRCFVPVIIVTVLCYLASLTGTVFMYAWFAPKPSCSLNILFITWTVILITAMTCISIHSKVKAGLMTSSLISLYTVFLCWSAIMSEPRSEVCNTRPRQTGKADLLTVMSFVLGIMAIVIATFNPFAPAEVRDASNQPPQPEKHVPYGYGFFHFVFAFGSMYLAMLFIGWNLYKWSIDNGWSSVWIKITNQWLAVGLYIWTMVAPLAFKNRDFN